MVTGHTITAHDASPLDNFIGSVVFGDSMNIENLTIKGTGFRTDCDSGLKGIAFNNTGGSVSNVKVEDITQHNGCATTGLGIWVKGQNVPRQGHDHQYRGQRLPEVGAGRPRPGDSERV